MATYSIDAPDGHTYQIEGPEGASDDQVRQQVLRQNPGAGSAPSPESATESVLKAAPRRVAQGFNEMTRGDVNESAPAAMWRGVKSLGTMLSFPTAPAGELAGVLYNGGDVSDANLQTRLAQLEKVDPRYREIGNAGEYDRLKQQLQIPEAERMAKDKEDFKNLVEMTTGAGLAMTPLPWWLGGGGRAAAMAPEAAEAAQGARSALQAADQMELPMHKAITQLELPTETAARQAAMPTMWDRWLKGLHGTPPTQLELGVTPQAVGQRGLFPEGGLPTGAKPDYAEDILRNRAAVNDFHQTIGSPSPVPPNPTPGNLKVPTPGWVERGVRAITGWKPEDYYEATAKAMAKSNAFFTPQDVARGNPAAMNIVREGEAASDVQHLITKDMGTQLKEVYQPFKGDEDAIKNIHRYLDGQPTFRPISPEELQAATKLRVLMDHMADMAGIPRERRLVDYFPHVREQVAQSLQLAISKDGAPVIKNIPQEYRVFFERNRTLPTDSQIDYGMKPIVAYLQGAAKKIAMSGGTMSDGTPVGGFINRVADHLESLPDVEPIRKYFAQYVNDLVRGPQSNGIKFMNPQTVSTIKQVEFLRTIGVNVMSPLNNLTQTLNTLAVTDLRAWGGAWYDLLSKGDILAKAKASGVVDQTMTASELSKMANPKGLQSLLGGATEKSAFLFQRAEEVNRLHAFAAGYRDALRQGMGERAALDYAKDIVNQTQFRFGPENLPNWLRSSNAGLQLVGQFKSYQINQMNFLRNLLVNNPKGLAKWAAASVMLGGQDVFGTHVGDGIRKLLATAIQTTPENVRYDGAKQMGVWFGNQLGLGALPAEDLKSLFFMLPGPFIGHVGDAMSGVSGRDFTPEGLATGNFGKPLTPEQRARHMTSSFNVQANRLRQALVMARTQGPNWQQPEGTGRLYDPTGLKQSFGIEPPTGDATRPKLSPGIEIAGKALGVPSTAGQQDFEKRQSIHEDSAAYKELVQKKAAAIKRGDTKAVQELDAEAQSRFGIPAPTRPGDVRKQFQRSNTPALDRAVKGSPKPIRGQELEKATK